MTKDQIIIVLLFMMAIVLTIELIYILVKKKRKEQQKLDEMNMFRKSKQPAETMADKAHNTILTVESISSNLARQGVNTVEADSLLSRAKDELLARDYGSAIEGADAAKIVLLRLKREHESKVPDRTPLHSDPGKRPMDRTIYEPAEPVREEKNLDSLPVNYVQAKFMLNTTKDIIEKRGISSGEAYDFYNEAIEHYNREDYTKALSLAIKAERRLDSGTLTLIGEERIPAANEEAIEVLVCPGCETEVSDNDAFCRKCGENLASARECPGCGTEYEPVDMFCRKCGKKLR